MKCNVAEYHPVEAKDCQGEVDEYYGTDGGLAPLCQFHMKKNSHVVWDGDHPMSKRYHDKVYEPYLTFDDECREQLYKEFEVISGLIPGSQEYSNFLVEWFKTEEGQSRVNEKRKLVNELYQKLIKDYD